MAASRCGIALGQLRGLPVIVRKECGLAPDRSGPRFDDVRDEHVITTPVAEQQAARLGVRMAGGFVPKLCFSPIAFRPDLRALEGIRLSQEACERYGAQVGFQGVSTADIRSTAVSLLADLGAIYACGGQ